MAAGDAMGKADVYRKRADGLEKTVRKRRKADLVAVRTKQTALRDMADNEDWLDGKPGTALRPKKK